MTPDGYAHRVLWRAFPRDIDAPDAAPFSPRSVTTPRFQNIGRFDQRGRPPVLYLADSPAHATTEILRRRLRSAAGADRHRITDADLVESGHRRALVSVRIRPFVADRLPDTSEGRVLDRPGIRADQLSLNSYRTSQAAARQIYEHSDEVPGFVWSSRFGGDWHVVLLFLDRAPLADLENGSPERLHLAHPAVIEAAEVLNVEIASGCGSGR